jgi:acyl-CoA synthetase (AMP-forming)/AMP-acid ligase II
MFHISGFTTQVIGGPYFGGTWVYPPAAAWREEVHLQLSERHRATAWSIVPTQLWRLLDYPGLDDYDLSSLRRVGGGGSTFQPELWRRVAERLPQVARMSTGYGMSETCGAGTLHDGSDAIAHPDAVGRPGPGMEIQIRDPLGAAVPEGVVGQIHLRGGTVMLGYWADPAATASSLDAERWYATGEMGHVADGLLYLDGRGSDLIVRGGENVYPIEIENRLVEHPGIAEAAVIGVEDRVLGQRVAAVVVLHTGADVDEADVQTWVGEALAKFKVPSEVRFVDALPHNAAGKVLKHRIGAAGEPTEEE